MQYTQSEKQKEESRMAQKAHEEREDRFGQEKEKKGKRKKIIIASVAVLALIIVALITYAALSPGKYDSFAKCLTEKGAIMQGEDWCKYTNAQKGMFGKSFKYINYEVNERLDRRPTWIIDGKTYETVQSFERLSALTGCEI